MKKKLIITIAIVLVIAIVACVAIAVSKKGGNEKDLILPEAKNDKIETKLPDDDKGTNTDATEKVNATYDEFMEIYEEYENETDEAKKREQLDKIQAILDSVSE